MRSSVGLAGAEAEAETRLEAFARIVEHGVVMENDSHERALLVPNYTLSRFRAGPSAPFATALFLRRDGEWAKHMRSTYFLYRLHATGTYLQTQSLSEALYLLSVYLFKREYGLASSLIHAVFTDVRFNGEEKYLKNTLTPLNQVAGCDIMYTFTV